LIPVQRESVYPGNELAHAAMVPASRALPAHPQDAIVAAYQHAKSRGLGDPGAYNMSNECEYWAEGSQAWFDATMRLGKRPCPAAAPALALPLPLPLRLPALALALAELASHCGTSWLLPSPRQLAVRSAPPALGKCACLPTHSSTHPHAHPHPHPRTPTHPLTYPTAHPHPTSCRRDQRYHHSGAAQGP
jgi:hypothetical protein